MQPLTSKQRLFVKEYLVDSNATRAAKAAGYSAKCADVQGSRLLANAKVRSEIDRQTEKRCAKLDITADFVLQGILKIVERGENAEEFSVALKGYELLGKHLKLFTDKTEILGDSSAIKIILHGGPNSAK